MYNFVFLGSAYSGKSGRDLFLSDVEIGKAALLERPPIGLRRSQIAFLPGTWKGNFHCKVVGTPGYHALQCKTANVLAECDKVTPAWNCAIIYLNGQGYGSGESRMAVIGVGNHDDSPATNTQFGGTFATRMGTLTAHEVGHSAWNLADCTTGCGIMGSMCNGGQCGYNLTYTPEAQDLINGILDGIAGPFTTDTTSPTITITSPVEGNSSTPSSGFNVRATLIDVAGVMRCELLFDGQVIRKEAFWARNIFANPNFGFNVGFNDQTHPGLLTSGQHAIQVKALDAAYNETLSPPVMVNVI